MSNTITEKEFKSDKKNIDALRGFLSTKQGKAYMAALEGNHPLHQLSDTKIKGAANQHAAAAGQSDGQIEGARSENLLGKIVGYQSSINFTEQLQIYVEPKKEKKSRKAGATAKPAPLPPT